MPPTTVRPSKRKHADGEREAKADSSGSGKKKSKEERRAEKRAKLEAIVLETESLVRRKDKTKEKSLAVPPNTSRAEFKLVRARTCVSLPPRFVGDARRGIEEILDNLVMRYVPSLRGVLLSHRDHTFKQNVALLYAEGPYPVSEVEFDAGVWAPEIGMRIMGRISLHATDHIGLLVHRTFNASIDRAHIPGDGEWEYIHGPVPNDPEINSEEQGDEEVGRWINSQTGETLGGETGLVEFTVIGYTIANQMLSLHGSLQPDPFAPEHNAARQAVVQPGAAHVEGDTVMEEVLAGIGGDDEVEADEEELAAPRGSKRKVVDVIPVAPEAPTEVTQKKKKKQKNGIVEDQVGIGVVETAAADQEGKKKRKRKKDNVNA